MIKRIFGIILMGCFFLNTAVFANTGHLFTVTTGGSSLDQTISFTLCLNINGQYPLSCQNYSTNKSEISIAAAVPNHTYAYAGIRINTAGYKFALSSGSTSLSGNFVYLGLLNNYQPATGTITNTTTNQVIVTPISSPNGTINPNTSQSIQFGDSITFHATADTGYNINQWFVNDQWVQIGGSTYTLDRVTSNTTIKVTFGLWGGTSIAPHHQFTSISCPTISWCMAVDNQGNAYNYNTGNWSSANPVSSYSLNSISCPSTAFCMAVDSQANAYKFNGTTWSFSAKVSDFSDDPSYGVSCTSSVFCMALNSIINHAPIFNGNSWNLNVVSGIDGSNSNYLKSVSCSSPLFCIVGSNLGNVSVYNGTTWAVTQLSTSQITTISCFSDYFCMAIDSDGKAYIYTTSWSLGTSVSVNNTINSVSCPDTNFCMAVDSAGYSHLYNGQSWETPVSADGTSITSVSCPNTSTCYAVDDQGNGLNYNAV